MKKIKSISFNDNNVEEKNMLKFFSRRNFSKYVKELIKEDMQRKLAEKRAREQQNKVKAQREQNGTLKINF